MKDTTYHGIYYCSCVTTRWQWSDVGNRQHKMRNDTQNNTRTIQNHKKTQNRQQKYKRKKQIKTTL